MVFYATCDMGFCFGVPLFSHSRLINAKAMNNDHDPTIYVESITVSMGIEPTALINTKATNNDHDPTNYVTSITVSMGIEPTAPHTGSTRLLSLIHI